MSRRYTISLDLSGKLCLVVGGGQVAERKVRSLLECGAGVKVVSPGLSPGLRALAAEGRIDYREGPYVTADLDGVFLVIGATDREEVNRRVADDCAARNLVVNIVDDPGKGNFFVPAVVRRGDLTIAVSTGGRSPMLARKIREELERAYGPQYGDFLEILGRLREKVIENESDENRKTEILERFVSEEILGLLKAGRLETVKERLESAYRGCGLEPPDGSG
ncbi:MAG: bifunctional precorrin-2 dehydrogenase/sirohydrochlorin ferrochelatase [Firmicutes bacterium]|nr:bifunctional precorrin-2 dehydrogenase/sirohydrochlorin ferrochelatase [Bacillota bacterium]